MSSHFLWIDLQEVHVQQAREIRCSGVARRQKATTIGSSSSRPAEAWSAGGSAEKESTISPEAVPALEQGARERGMTYRDYVAWVAALRKEEIFGYQDQIRNGDESAIPRHVYEAWDYVHMRLRER